MANSSDMDRRSTSVAWAVSGLKPGASFGPWIALILLALFALGSCQTVERGPVGEQVMPTTPVVLTSGDVVRVTFTTAPELNQSQKIRSDGKISLPQVGEVTAAGRTPMALQNELSSLFKSQLKNTDVLVSLESAAIQVYLSGSVHSPGKLQFDRPTTILQAIMEAGGPDQFGNLRKVHLIRMANGIQRTQILNLKPTLSGESTRPFYVKNGDIISVPQTAF
ncbi:MAG: polysaccharide biosynthesis/export family protein [Chthoniobacterales bacterium]